MLGVIAYPMVLPPFLLYGLKKKKGKDSPTLPACSSRPTWKQPGEGKKYEKKTGRLPGYAKNRLGPQGGEKKGGLPRRSCLISLLLPLDRAVERERGRGNVFNQLITSLCGMQRGEREKVHKSQEKESGEAFFVS